MATQSTAPRRPVPNARPSPFAWIVGALATLIGSITVSLILGCLVEWVGMHFWWAGEGAGHAHRCLTEDLAYLADYRRSLIVPDGQALALQSAHWAGQMAFVLPPLVRRSAAARAAPASGASPGRFGFGQDLLRAVGPYAESAYYVIQDTAVRLAVVVLALPAFAVAVVVGLTDGLIRRDLRRWSGGRESSAIYHYSKRWLWPASTVGFTLYLAWPTSGLNPASAILPGFLAMAALLSLMAASFKKYL